MIPYGMAKSKLDPFVHLLGVTPDADIARLAGCSRERVRQVRYVKGIPLGKVRGWHNLLPQAAYDAVADLAGTLSDLEVAQRAGCSATIVQKYRRKHGIPRFPHHNPAKTKFSDEHVALMGTMPDKALAKLMGVGHMVVFLERKRRGIEQRYDGRSERWKKEVVE